MFKGCGIDFKEKNFYTKKLSYRGCGNCINSRGIKFKNRSIRICVIIPEDGTSEIVSRNFFCLKHKLKTL
jgi:hypothetical protein